MHNMSMTQALSLWCELEDAYNGVNSYGGEEAEIYVSRAMPYSGLWLRDGPIAEENNRELALQANRSLYVLFRLYAEKREVDILVDEQPLGEWMVDSRFRHRWHVKVVRGED